jgi:hypothetical protein
MPTLPAEVLKKNLTAQKNILQRWQYEFPHTLRLNVQPFDFLQIDEPCVACGTPVAIQGG